MVDVMKRINDYVFYNHINLKGRLMNTKTSKLSTIVIISLLVFTMTGSICSADEWSRKGKTEIFGTIQQMDGENAEYLLPDTLPVIFDMDSTTVYGIGYGYNLTDHWNFNMDLLFGSTDTDIKIIDVVVETQDMDYILWDINLDYNILKSRLTPLVTGGIGVMDFGIDTTTRVGEVHESNFSYNLGAGVRWDVKDNILLKLIYRSTWTGLEDADSDQRFDGVSFSVAYMF
jgi:opacity protein-like surface antigen